LVANTPKAPKVNWVWALSANKGESKGTLEQLKNQGSPRNKSQESIEAKKPVKKVK
jgi:hypothetical protein